MTTTPRRPTQTMSVRCPHGRDVIEAMDHEIVHMGDDWAPCLAYKTPAEVDAAWFPLMAATERALGHVLSVREAKRGAEAGESRAYWDASREQHLAELVTQHRDAQAAELPYRAEWERRGGWTRYPHVMAAGGHFHRDRACPTCFITTQYGAVADVSGLTEQELVEKVGHHACTVCFPWAPTTAAWGRTLREEEAAKTLAKHEKKWAAREKLTKKVANAQRRLDRATQRGDEFDQRWAHEDVERAQRELGHWDERNPGYQPGAAPVA